ncbi:MAG: carbon-nitrogen hydrolase family protein [Bacillota bacterium]|nr:carbon-nitrogen hydrolase family protein [Bacillota bacterium]
MNVKVALVQTKVDESENSYEINIQRAYDYIDNALKTGAQLICFPESYPGPWKKPLDFSPHDDLARIAKQKSIYLIYGTAEEAEGHPGRHRIVQVMLGPDGNTVGKYMRTSPLGPWIYRKSRFWDLEYLEAEDLPVFETDLGVIGMLICSEVYVPELSRILAIKGAEITFLPAGIYKAELLDTWRTLIHARAIENLMYTATCQNILGAEEGLCMVASPENIIGEIKTEGVLTVDIDLQRIREMREATDQYSLPLQYRTKPGLLKQWRRPVIYGDLVK